MEDYLNYMNSVSESESVLNQVSAIKENILNQGEEAFSQVELSDENKDQLKEQILGLPSELAISTAGTFLAKKALSYVSSKIGVSEDTVSKFVSGDIEGGLKQGLGELATKNLPVGGQGSPAEDPDLQGSTLEDPPMEPEQEGDIELDDLSPPSQDDALDMLAGEERPAMSSADLPEGAGAIEDLQTPIMDAGESLISSAGDIASGIASSAGDVVNAGGEIATSVINSAASTAADVATSVASTAGDVAGAVASTAGEVAADTAAAGLEAAGAALDATGIGAIAGGFLGLIGGIVGFFEGSHHSAPKEVAPILPFEPILNPSSQIL
jgi:hypothetical protein